MTHNFDQIRFALEEHLSAINENTAEIQSLFDYIHEMEVKVDKVIQRLDQLQLSQGINPIKSSIVPLNHNEKKVFLILYTEESPLCFDEIAVKTDFSSPVVQECVSSLAGKGIPLVRSHFNDKMFVKLEPEFKEIQAKQNLINLSLESFMD